MMRNVHSYDEGSSELIAFVAGALIGAGIALLLTPQRGTELRVTFATTPIARRTI